MILFLKRLLPSNRLAFCLVALWASQAAWAQMPASVNGLTANPKFAANCCKNLWSYPSGNTTFSSQTGGLAYDPTGPGTLYVGGVSAIQAVNPTSGATITT